MATPAPFVAAVFAGGQSRRLGRDKASLPWAGRRLIDHQIDLVRALGPSAVIVSGRTGVDYEVTGAQLVRDTAPGHGPLGGLAAVLGAIDASHVVVLAVDLPAMTMEFLRDLLAQRTTGTGVVPRTTAGWEPLAAVYPRELLPLVRDHLHKGDLALYRLVEAGVAAGRLRELRVPDHAAGIFKNLNSPPDLAGDTAGGL